MGENAEKEFQIDWCERKFAVVKDISGWGLAPTELEKELLFQIVNNKTPPIKALNVGNSLALT